MRLASVYASFVNHSSNSASVFVVRCIVCDEKKARVGSLTCSETHACTLRQWIRRHREPKRIVFDGLIAPSRSGFCLGCGKPLLSDVDNGRVRYHVECSKIAKKIAHERSATS